MASFDELWRGLRTNRAPPLRPAVATITISLDHDPLGRKSHQSTGTFVPLAFERKTAAVQLDELARQGQAKPGTFPCPAGPAKLHEGLKRTINFVLFYPDTTVFDAKQSRAALLDFNRHTHRPFVTGELHRDGDKVQDDLSDSPAVGAQTDRAVACLVDHHHPATHGGCGIAAIPRPTEHAPPDGHAG